jgi:hypothetical protein
MHDFVHLRRELLVQLGNHLLDGIEHVRFDEAGVGKRLLDQRLDRVLDLGGCPLGSRLEALLQECRKLVGITGFYLRFLGGADFCRLGRHGHSLRLRIIFRNYLRPRYPFPTRVSSTPP